MEKFITPRLESGLYRHYKGNLYTVFGVGCHSETNEYLVVYSPVGPKAGAPSTWLRPYDMFIETVLVNGKEVPRFEKESDVTPLSVN